MPSAPDIRQFIARLRAAGFALSTADVLRLTNLIARLAAERPSGDRGLKSVLCPLIARSADEQARFGHLYDEFFQPRVENTDIVPPPAGRAGAVITGATTVISDPPPEAPWWKSRWLAAIAVCALLLIFTNSGPPWQSSLRAQTETNPTPPPPEPVPPLQQAGTEHPVLLDLAFILAALLATELVRSVAMTLGHRRRRAAGRPFDWPLNDRGRPRMLFQNDTFVRAARLLRGREAGEGTRLDLARSITETIRNLDDPVLAYRSQSVLPEYLFLIERRTDRDHLADYLDALVSALDDLGVIIERYYFERDPRYCWQTTPSARVHVSDLQQRFPVHRIVVCGEPASVLDPITGRTASWVRAHFSWSLRALLVPDQRSAAGARDWFEVHHASSAGLERLAEHWTRPDADMKPVESTSVTVDDAATVDELRAALPGETFRWLVRCVTYPVLQWPLTRALAPPHLRGEAHEAALLQLASLPWFRRGVIPPAERHELSMLLARSKADAVAVRDVTLRLLAATTAPDGTAAAQMIGIQLLAQSAWRANAAGEAALPWLRKLRDYPSGHLDRDSSLTRFLGTIRSPGSSLPAVLRRAIFRRGVPALGFRSFLWTALLVPALATLAGMLAFMPPGPVDTTTATSATGATYPDTPTSGTTASSDTSFTTATDTSATSSFSATGMTGMTSTFVTETSATGTTSTSFTTDTSLTDTSATEQFPLTGTTATTGTTPQVTTDTAVTETTSTASTASSARTDSADFYFEVECFTSIPARKGTQDFKLQRGERIIDAKVTTRTVSGGPAVSSSAEVLAINGNTVDFQYGGTNESREASPGCPPARIQVHIVVTISPARPSATS